MNGNYGTIKRRRADLFLLLLLLQDFGDLLLERIELLRPFTNHFRRDLPMADLILAAGGVLYGRLEHLAIRFAHERDGSVKCGDKNSIEGSVGERAYRPFLPARAVRPTRWRYCASWPGMS